MKLSEKISSNPNPLVIWMAQVSGLGVILAVVALGIGVIQGEGADSNLIGLLLVAGLILFILGAVAWFGLTQPQRHFDDINVPMEADHHGDDHHDEHAIEAVHE